MKTGPCGGLLTGPSGWLYSGRAKIHDGDGGRGERGGHSGQARGIEIGYISVLLAVAVGIVHAGLSPEIEVAGVHPNLMLVAVVLVTALLGFGPGVVWAFAGGLTANLLTHEPLGSVPLSLLLVSAMVAGGDRLFGRLIWLYPILAAFAGSILADLVILGVFRLMAEGPTVVLPIDLILPAAVLNAALTGVLLYPARLLTRNLILEEKPAW